MLAAVNGEPLTSAAAAPCNAAPVVAAPVLGADGTYAFAAGGLELSIDPRLDGEPTRLALDGETAVPSPRAVSTAYSAKLEGESLRVSSPSGERGVLYRLDPGRRSLEVTYTLTNTTKEVEQLRGYDTRSLVLRNGLVLSGTTWSAQVVGRLVFVEVFLGPWPPARELAPAASTSWNVRWLLRRLPEHLTATPGGNPELLAFVEGVIQ